MAVEIVNLWDPVNKERVPMNIENNRLQAGAGDQGTVKQIRMHNPLTRFTAPLLFVNGKMQITTEHIAKDLWMTPDVGVNYSAFPFVDDWESNEGDNYHYTSGSGERPAHRLEHWNGFDSLEFAASSDEMRVQTGGTFGYAIDEFTFLCYMDPDAGDDTVFDRWFAGSSLRSYRIDTNKVWLSSNGDNFGEIIEWTVVSGPQIYAVRYSGSLQILEARINKAQKAINTSPYASLNQSATNIMRIGYHSNDSNHFNGHLGDVYFFKRYLPNEELFLFEDLLESKYEETPSGVRVGSDGAWFYHNVLTREPGTVAIDNSEMYAADGVTPGLNMTFWNWLTKEMIEVAVKDNALQITTGSTGTLKQIPFWDVVTKTIMMLNVYDNKIAVNI